MPITFRCSDCTQKLRIEDDFAGKRVACVRCGSKQRVPLVSSPEFLQAAIAPPEPPAPSPLSVPPKLQEPAGGESDYEESPPYEPPSHQPIWFKAIEPAEIEPLAIEPAPPDAESLLPEPDVSEPVDLGPTLPEPILPAHMLVEPTEPEDFHQERTAAVARTRRVSVAARAEPSLVPPYKKLDVEEMIDMTAMVDIVFFLLIFFLVTSMHALDSTIPMPTPDPQKGAPREPKSVAAIDSDDSYVVVRIDRNDKILVEGSEVRSDRELLFKLRDLRMGAAHPEKLLVVGHGDATHGTVVMVLDAGRELGMDQVRLTMQDEAD